MRAADPWSRERIALLENLWAEGASAQSIAARLGGVSRSAVLGKIFRLRRKAARSASSAAMRNDQREAPRDRQSPARTRGKNLLELGNESCRWPHGRPGSARFHFCGASGADLENGMPYCPQHAARAYLQHPGSLESPQASVPGASQLTDRPAGQRRSAWRALLRHPAAARWE